MRADSNLKLEHRVALNIYKDVMFNFAEGFSLKKSVQVKSHKENYYPIHDVLYYRHNMSTRDAVTTRCGVSTHELAFLICDCDRIGARDEAYRLLSKMQDGAEGADEATFAAFLLPS